MSATEQLEAIGWYIGPRPPRLIGCPRCPGATRYAFHPFADAPSAAGVALCAECGGYFVTREGQTFIAAQFPRVGEPGLQLARALEESDPVRAFHGALVALGVPAPYSSYWEGARAALGVASDAGDHR